MNILISISESFLHPAALMLYSLSRYNTDLDVYLIYSSLTEEKLAELGKFCRQRCNVRLHPIYAGNFFENAPLSEQFCSPELYYRLLAPHILPQNMDRLLYLDADIIVTGSLSELYNMKLSGTCAAFAKDKYEFCGEVQAQKKKLGLGHDHVYFNSGVILFDLSACRHKLSLERMLGFIETNREKLHYFDQDTLNCLLGREVVIFDDRYNFQAYPFESYKEDWLEKNVSVLHFVDLPKPWSEEYHNEVLLRLYKKYEDEAFKK